MVIDRALTDLVSRKTDARILLLEAPPRHGKSELISKYLPAWYVGRYPNRRVMLATYSDTFSRSWGRKARDLINRTGHWFGIGGVRPDVSAAAEWDLAGFDGGMISAGVGGLFTGKGADLMVIDDPIKNAEEAISETIRASHWDWFQSTAWTRLEPGGVVVVMMTRWHEEDLIGTLASMAEEEFGVGVQRVTLPALAMSDDDPLGREYGAPLWPERLPLEELEKRRAVLDDYWWNAMYQQRPGQYGKTEWPDDYFKAPFWSEVWPDSFEASAIFTDPSKGSDQRRGDYSANVFAGLTQGKIWIEADIARRPPSQIVQDGVAMDQRLGCDAYGVEENAFQFLLADVFDDVCRELNIPPLPITLVNQSVNKQLRISRLGPYLKRHNFRFRDTPGTRLLVKQLKAFPLGDHDDGPDALEGAVRLLRWFLSNRRQPDREEVWTA